MLPCVQSLTIITEVVSSNPSNMKVYSIQHQVFYRLAAGRRWFSPGTPVSSTNKTDRHHITEIL
jgi:hypothetical protein